MGPRDMRMFYHSFDARTQKWTVGTATSKDGFVWTKRGPIFSGSESGSDFDGKGAAACHVVSDYTTKRYPGAPLMHHVMGGRRPAAWWDESSAPKACMIRLQETLN